MYVIHEHKYIIVGSAAVRQECRPLKIPVSVIKRRGLEGTRLSWMTGRILLSCRLQVMRWNRAHFDYKLPNQTKLILSLISGIWGKEK
jgi:hypothetical protein